MGALHDLLSVQRSDIAIVQANHRLTHLPEIEARREAMERLAQRASLRAEVRARQAESRSSIEACERRSAEIDTAVARLESQLKKVIAPREAEALQHEIATLRDERSALDDVAIEMLMRTEQDDQLEAELGETIAALEREVEEAQRALREAQDLEQEQIRQLAERRGAQALVVPSELLQRYESRRTNRKDAVVAELHGSACDACHLDLSQTERDELRRLADDEIPECPHCGCILVL
jgi:predicted  nucleic acid-binding Zn-ribbon protein